MYHPCCQMRWHSAEGLCSGSCHQQPRSCVPKRTDQWKWQKLLEEFWFQHQGLCCHKAFAQAASCCSFKISIDFNRLAITSTLVVGFERRVRWVGLPRRRQNLRKLAKPLPHDSTCWVHSEIFNHTHIPVGDSWSMSTTTSSLIHQPTSN